MTEQIDPVQLPFGIGQVDYTKYSNRKLATIPLAVLAVALTILVIWAAVMTPTGTPVAMGIDFTGGTEVQIQTTDSRAEIDAAFGDADASIQQIQGLDNTWVVTFQSDDTDAIQQQAQQAGYEVRSIQSKSAAFSKDSQMQAIVGVAIAFLGMSIIVFLLFRSFVPSIAVVVSAFSDMMIPLALMNLFGIKLSLGTVAALLMLIGYSVDSDLLLNNHVLRRRGTFYESAYRAMRTGVTMTLTSLSAISVMTIVAEFFGIPLMPEIGVVLVFGLVADLMNTYLLNMSLLRWYKYEGVAR